MARKDRPDYTPDTATADDIGAAALEHIRSGAAHTVPLSVDGPAADPNPRAKRPILADDALPPDAAADASGNVTLPASVLQALLQGKAAPAFDMDAFAKAITQANRTEGHSNATHPGVSVYNPLGERDHPKPPFVCKMRFCNYDIQHETSTPREVELLNAIPAGRYLVQRSDDSFAELIVEERRDRVTQHLERKIIVFKAGDQEENKNWMPLHKMLTDAMDTAKQAEYVRMARSGLVAVGQ